MVVDVVGAQSLLSLDPGDTIDRAQLSTLIQRSKIRGSDHWQGAAWIVSNTPQQGINWVGPFPNLNLLLIKARPGAYDEDGWADSAASLYRYSFKAIRGTIHRQHRANLALTNQANFGYPILLLSLEKSKWVVSGYFKLESVADKFVVLRRAAPLLEYEDDEGASEDSHSEGLRSLVSHYRVERNREVVKNLKRERDWICDVCAERFEVKYDLKYIEAHHKTPLASSDGPRVVTTADFALLCPNCHAAIHLMMKRESASYSELRHRLKRQLRIR